MQLKELLPEGTTDFYSINPRIKPESKVVEHEFLGSGGYAQVTRYKVSGRNRAIHRPRSKHNALGPAHLTKNDLENLAGIDGIVTTEAVALFPVDNTSYAVDQGYGLMVQQLLPKGCRMLSDTYFSDNTYQERLQWMASLLETVEGLGSIGVVHRDIKPENIGINGKQPVLIDIGIAAQEGSRCSSGGRTLGTPSYMSPEQARTGNGLTNASDIYSWGAVFAEVMETRGFPVDGYSAMDIMLRIVGRHKTPTKSDIRVPEPLVDEVHKILALALANKTVKRNLDEIMGRVHNAKAIAQSEGL